MTRQEILESKDYKELMMPVDTNISINKVILSDENKEKIKQFLAETAARDTFRKYHLEPMNRILMYGDSGTGKTFLSKALANYMRYTMFYVDIAKALSEKTVAANISKVFQLSNALGNSILFFDECDGIAWARDRVSPDGDTARVATNSLFQHLDQMNPTNVFIGATNMLHRLDPAFERRFNLKMEFRKPKGALDPTIRKFMFKEFTYVQDMNEQDRLSMDRRVSDKLSYFEIQGAVERAMKDSLLRNTLVVKETDLYNIFASIAQIKNRFGTAISDEKSFSSPINTFTK